MTTTIYERGQTVYLNEWIILSERKREYVDGDRVHVYGIALTDIAVVEAWEADRGHSTITHAEDGTRLGKTCTRPVPDLPGLTDSQDAEIRAMVAREWIADSHEAAREMILE